MNSLKTRCRGAVFFGLIVKFLIINSFAILIQFIYLGQLTLKNQKFLLHKTEIVKKKTSVNKNVENQTKKQGIILQIEFTESRLKYS